MVFKSPFPDIDIPKCNILDFMFPTDKVPSDKPLWMDADDPSHSLSPRSALQWIKRLGFGMERLGIKRGDACLIFTPNHIYVPVAYLGFVGYGASFSGSNPAFTVKELLYQMKILEAKMIFVHPDLVPTALDAAAQAGIPKSRLKLFADQYHEPIQGVEDWRRIVGTELEGAAWQWTKLSPEESLTQVATVNFSSGTTGLPKGVCISHRNLIANALQINVAMGLTAGWERWVGFLPLCHAYGQCFMILTATTLHIPVLVMRKFDFEKYLEIVQQHKITRLQLVPPIMIMLDKRPEAIKYDFSSVKNVLCGAAPLSKELQDAVAAKLNVRVFQAWGMTETTNCGIANHPSGMNPEGSIGRVIPNTEIKLVDDDGNEITKPGVRGEIYIRGPQIGLRYWRNLGASTDSFNIDGEGWFKTGDVALLNKHEYIWLVDRKKELIKVNGLQVSPAELEALLLESEDIADAAVVGITVHDVEMARAYVTLKDSTIGKVTERDVQDWVKERVAKHKQLRGGVVFIPEVPKLASGKIERKVVRQWAIRDAKDIEAKALVGKAKL